MNPSSSRVQLDGTQPQAARDETSVVGRLLSSGAAVGVGAAAAAAADRLALHSTGRS